MKLPEVTETPNGRRSHYRLTPAKMVAVIDSERFPEDVADPDVVVDFSVSGVGLLSHKELQVDEKILVTLFYEKLTVVKIPATIRSVRRLGDLNRAGMELDVSDPYYQFQKETLKNMEFQCIEKGQF